MYLNFPLKLLLNLRKILICFRVGFILLIHHILQTFEVELGFYRLGLVLLLFLLLTHFLFGSSEFSFSLWLLALSGRTGLPNGAAHLGL